MTIIDEILISANKIANEGKKPTVALIKGKLTSPAPLPTIINVLKTWQHDENFTGLAQDTAIENENSSVQEENTSYCTKDDLDRVQQNIIKTLSLELKSVSQDLLEIKKLLAPKQ